MDKVTTKDVHVLPAICTRGVVVFPGQDVMIEVGRPKSIAAIDVSAKDFDNQVFIVCQNDIMVDDPTQKDLYTVGTLAKIKIVRRKEGFMRVTFTGERRCVLQETHEQDGYMVAEVYEQGEILGDMDEEKALIDRIIAAAEKSTHFSESFPPHVIASLSKGVSALTLTNQFGQYFPLDLATRQKLLETQEVNERMMILLSEFHRKRHFEEIEVQINDRVKESISESQKEYFLREKLKAIKEELGDVSNVSDDSDKLRAMIEENPYPEHVKEKALEELKRYEMLPQSSAEASVVRSYLDWLLKTPWYKTTEDNEDLKHVRQVLDEDHYGLEKVKDRIMEYLAVKQMTGTLDAPIICLAGPPGVGKTSLAKSIARSIDREFVKMSVGGVSDESEIRGHRRTYLGSLPGRIVQGMKKAQVVNPVFLIDEIDKMGKDFKGDPSAALLEVLDPEQNKFFSDHYLEEPYDLSKVMFIATANYLQDIPGPLRDRLEIIELPSYTELDKLKIARQYLVPKQVKKNGLQLEQFAIHDEDILFIIRHYTRESGVRQLERMVATLCRKAVLQILSNGVKEVLVTHEMVKEWLGKEIFDYGTKEKKNEVGVVTGLAYTSFGGDILPVEVNYFEGKGRLVLTGKLGDVMKESASIALDYIKSHADEFKIDVKFFDTHDLHIHVPEGAVPKDGPSAGVTMTTAIVSAITNRAVDANLAMTGEVTLRGHVLPIGGLREKSLAASRAGITKIVMPKKNERDLDELPEEVRNQITFVPVETMAEVLKEALVD